MTPKCTLCGGALTFDADLQKMVCDYCCSMFDLSEFSDETGNPSAETPDAIIHMKPKNDLSNTSHLTEELMDCQIYSCKNCGAELVINDVELSTYCAYCGQPTIVFERAEKRKKPDYIIPFSISKEVALTKIKEELSKGEYIPAAIKNFEVSMLRGIYIPYALFDITCRTKALIHGHPLGKANNDEEFWDYFRDGYCEFKHFPVDASSLLPNASSERLDPYLTDLTAMCEFRPDYLSGFYADLRDDDFSLLQSLAKKRATDMVNEEILSTINADKMGISRSTVNIQITDEHYALFPVWFLVFEQDGESYTILVNGQTGKVVGAVPVSRAAFLKWFFISFFFLSLFCIPGMLFIAFAGSIQYLLFAGLVVCSVVVAAIKKLTSVAKSIEMTKSSRMRTLVKNRQKH